jgi:hypothetical protein
MYNITFFFNFCFAMMCQLNNPFSSLLRLIHRPFPTRCSSFRQLLRLAHQLRSKGQTLGRQEGSIPTGALGTRNLIAGATAAIAIATIPKNCLKIHFDFIICRSKIKICLG